MNDMELTKLCAEAMGIEWRQIKNDLWTDVDECELYNPLHDDAQCMALVKKFMLAIGNNADLTFVVYGKDFAESENPDLNRAIVECVAKMQQAKGEA